MKQILRKLIKDENGQSQVEYGIIIALISIAAIGSLTALGKSLFKFGKPDVIVPDEPVITDPVIPPKKTFWQKLWEYLKKWFGK